MMKVKYIFIYSLSVFLLLAVKSVTAQQTLSLEEAWKRAATVSADANFLNSIYGLAEAESKVGVVMPFLSTLVEAGQVNSAFTDTKITVSQSGYFPSYHKAFKNRQEGSKLLASSEKQLREWDIRRLVTSLYVQYHYLTSVKDLYENQDSVFRQALERAKLRFSTGESDGVEVVEATAQLSHLQQMRQEAESMMNMVLTVFRSLTGTSETTFPGEIDDVTTMLPIDVGRKNEAQHPYLQKLETEMLFHQMEANWKRAQRKPMWTLAFNNTSFRGIGADDRVYGASSRFSSVQLGIAFPIFGSQSSKIDEVIKRTEEKTTAEKYLAEMKITNQRNTALLRWQRLQDQMLVFEQQSLPLAAQLQEIARNKLKNGEIDFMKYAYMTEQAQSLLLDYASLKKQVNEAAVDYHFVTF